MITKPEDILPSPPVLEELYSLGALPFDWMELVPEAPPVFRIQFNVARLPPLIARLSHAVGWAELCPMLAISKWLQGGPKVCRPSAEQAEALGQVAVSLELKDYAQPFPAVACEVPFAPFKAVLCYRHRPDVLILCAVSDGNADDVTCAIRQEDDRPIEDFLNTVADDVTPLMGPLLAAQRLALNMMLALTNFGHVAAPLDPKRHAEDLRLSGRDDDAGHRAKLRARANVFRVDFPRTVVIRRTVPHADSTATGRTVRQHWVRGHWKMQPCGAGMKERKRILIAPYLTHAEEAPAGQAPVTAYVDRR